MKDKPERPIYETADDRQREWQAVEILSDATHTFASPAPRLTGWDYELRRHGKVVAIVEVKCRNCDCYTYPTYMISKAKVERLRETALSKGVAGGLLVHWRDALGWLRVEGMSPEDWHIETGGRTDRQDPLDIESVIHFPISQFRMISRNRRAFI